MSDPATPATPATPGASVTDMRIGLVGLASMLAATALVLQRPEWSFDFVGPFLMVATAAPMIVLDVVFRKVHRRASSGIDWDRAWSLNTERVLTKWLGAVTIVGAVLAFYFFTPEYQAGFYDPFYALMWNFGPISSAFALAYMAWADGRMADPYDGYWHLGLAVRGRWREADLAKIADLARGWVIKGFFIPLMYVYMSQNLDTVRKGLTEPNNGMLWFDLPWNLGFLVDVVFTTLGYLLSIRILDTHIRSAEPTLLGWMVAIVCYQPFFGLVNRQYLFYEDGFFWGHWLNPFPGAKWFWGGGLLITMVVYAWATVAFGCRFSNLTHRGILTNGPYRFSKHPAYLAKIASFWMIFVPFVYTGSAFEVVRDCTWLAALSFIYFLRARTEERHLSADPDYVRYAVWMNDNGLLAWLGRRLPFFRYRPPEGG